MTPPGTSPHQWRGQGYEYSSKPNSLILCGEKMLPLDPSCEQTHGRALNFCKSWAVCEERPRTPPLIAVAGVPRRRKQGAMCLGLISAGLQSIFVCPRLSIKGERLSRFATPEQNAVPLGSMTANLRSSVDAVAHESYGIVAFRALVFAILFLILILAFFEPHRLLCRGVMWGREPRIFHCSLASSCSFLL